MDSQQSNIVCSTMVEHDGVKYEIDVIEYPDMTAFAVDAYASDKLIYGRVFDKSDFKKNKFDKYYANIKSAVQNKCISVGTADHLTALNIKIETVLTLHPLHIDVSQYKLYIKNWADRNLDKIREDYESARVKQ